MNLSATSNGEGNQQAHLIPYIMKSTKVQTSPIYRSHALKHIPQSTEPRAVLGSKYAMATPAEFVKLSER